MAAGLRGRFWTALLCSVHDCTALCPADLLMKDASPHARCKCKQRWYGGCHGHSAAWHARRMEQALAAAAAVAPIAAMRTRNVMQEDLHACT